MLVLVRLFKLVAMLVDSTFKNLVYFLGGFPVGGGVVGVSSDEPPVGFGLSFIIID
jgi:hypothetical protein